MFFFLLSAVKVHAIFNTKEKQMVLRVVGDDLEMEKTWRRELRKTHKLAPMT